MLARITRRMTGSDLLGCVAGLLLALDGLELVMSRTAMLDIFVMFWVLAGFGCLVIDRDQALARLSARSPGLPPEGAGPRLGIRWWRIAAGCCLGLAAATKWNGLFFLVLFAPLCVIWDMTARHGVPLVGLPGRASGAGRLGPATAGLAGQGGAVRRGGGVASLVRVRRQD
jgi:dolichyl-phosphate-mannose--protein O-mannosyl transferase